MPFKVREICIPAVALVFGGMGFVVCNLIITLLYWRVWHYNSPVVVTMWLGLWNYCYLPRDPTDPLNTLKKVCVKMNTSWDFPLEITLSQDLMSFASLLEGVAFLFVLMGLSCTLKKEPYPEFIKCCYQVSGSFLTLGCTIVLGTIFWNFYLDSINSHFTYPTAFLLTDFPVKREIGGAIPLGMVSSLLVLQSGAILLAHGCGVKAIRQIQPVDI
ncbi:uncharacterized protein LOC103170854 [Ornithorhynchus anatinus]|uniref:uncharacterized protein LOC103170854 n=1 Tax=Ornithorhynchus anatinus TaxID=9258 RepID=UPI0004546925|nr:uncharacterized protein LOC103170854 [Ornithorhynchus anatinus]XP_007668610.1 uncharacterized protein LOC103170854 [Ornithorhynchus anatinus]XP_007668612.1 uncharacterized protein LOC103170854 [Ornithorhynchus anatinus]